MAFAVEQLAQEHIPDVVALQAACFPPPFPEDLLWNESHLRRHLDVFPAGQFVAFAVGNVIGSATSLIITEENWAAHLDWESTVGGHYLGKHHADGSTLYGVDVSVHPDYRGLGVGRAMYEARFALVERLGLARYGTACRIPDWLAWSTKNGGAGQEAYCTAVVAGTVVDRTLTPLLRYGLNFKGVIHGYMDDEEAGNAAALLEWTP